VLVIKGKGDGPAAPNTYVVLSGAGGKKTRVCVQHICTASGMKVAVLPVISGLHFSVLNIDLLRQSRMNAK
jgi:hypothetical protein